MKTKKFILSSLLLMTAAAILFTGCRKREEEDNDTSSASDHAFAESSFNDLSTIAEQASTGSLSTFKVEGDEASLLSACATITFNNANTSNTDTLTIDFGTTNCLCSDGRYRRGKVIVTYTGGMQYRDSGLTATIVPSNFFVNNHQLLGTKTVVNRGHINSGRLQWDITVNGTVILANNGGDITWQTNKTKVLLSGETVYNGPINWATASWQITGTVTGIAANDEPFTVTTTSPLIRDMNCTQYRRYFRSGTFEFAPGSRPIRYVDFGTGLNMNECDNKATVTVNNNVYTITLP
jgi:hypothetical protein